MGFKENELTPENKPKLEDITRDVIKEVKEIEKESGKEIPVVVAGGVFDGKDIAKYMKLWSKWCTNGNKICGNRRM